MAHAAQRRRKVDRIKRRKNNTRKKSAASLRRELQDYENQGTHLYLNNRPSSADEIVHACLLAEPSGYMRDFIGDDAEHITEIHFIRIPRQEKI